MSSEIFWFMFLLLADLISTPPDRISIKGKCHNDQESLKQVDFKTINTACILTKGITPCILSHGFSLRWLETVSSTFQDLEFDWSL